MVTLTKLVSTLLFFQTPISSADISSMFCNESRSTTNDAPLNTEDGAFEHVNLDDLRDE